jgi:hypothetical protein
MTLRPALLTLLSLTCLAQETVLRSKSELVLAPVSITDKSGHPVRDLTESDLILYDDNVPQRIQLEDITLPISLAIAIQTTPEAQIVLDKLRKATGVIGPMITGAKGEAAVVSFGKEIRVVQPFTSNEDDVARAIKHLDADGAAASLGDAVTACLQLLAARPAGHRRVLLILSEKHDMGTTKEQIATAAVLAQKQNITVYSMTFSPSASQWTSKVPVYCDPPASLGKCVRCRCGNCGNQCDREDGKPQKYVPVQSGGLNLGALIGAAAKAAQVNAGDVLARATGGEQTEFATKNGLDGVLDRIGRDIHGQYLISFAPTQQDRGAFHRIRVEVKGRPNLTIRTRPGYWLSPE